MRIDYVERARALVGTRFRPQGRDDNGLDCVGVVLRTFGIAPEVVRSDYSLRGVERDEVERGLERHFRRVPVRDSTVGDVLLLSMSSDQLHLGVRTAPGLVHAHAGIGRVVETPGSPPGAVLAAYRKRISAPKE